MTPVPTSTPEAPAVLDLNVFRPDQGQPLHIGLKSASGGHVLVHIFNTAAELVRTPFEADIPAGITIDAVWDGRNESGQRIAAGVYIVSVQGAGISRLLKVVVMR
jgi:hypothetical protein